MPVTPSSRCILVLEDSVLVAMAIEAALADRGYEAILAGTLAAAHERLGHALPVAALLDLHLPDGNSVELARSLNERGCNVAICSGSDALREECGFAEAATGALSTTTLSHGFAVATMKVHGCS